MSNQTLFFDQPKVEWIKLRRSCGGYQMVRLSSLTHLEVARYASEPAIHLGHYRSWVDMCEASRIEDALGWTPGTIEGLIEEEVSVDELFEDDQEAYITTERENTYHTYMDMLEQVDNVSTATAVFNGYSAGLRNAQLMGGCRYHEDDGTP